MKFTIEEIKNYLESQDSLGDIHYYLSEENIKKANVKDGPEYGIFLLAELQDALETFGEYTYNDKGAHEVMSIGNYVKELNKMAIEEVAEVLTYLLDNHDNSIEMVCAIIGDMEDREDFDELFELDNRFEY